MFINQSADVVLTEQNLKRSGKPTFDGENDDRYPAQARSRGR